MASPKSTLKLRGKTYYLHYSAGGKRCRISLGTDSLRIAEEKQRLFDSARARGVDSPLPTQTPLAPLVEAYIQDMASRRTRNGMTSALSYLRKIFGPICPALEHGRRCRKALRVPVDRRLRDPVIAAVYAEEITTAQIAEFIRERVLRYHLQPKTANGYREVLQRFFNWAMEEGGVRMPGDRNPAAGMRRYRERAPNIRFLTKPQIEAQLAGLATTPWLQTMVAVFIYAGLRREEALWLTREDVDLRQGRHGMIRIQAKTTASGEFWEPKTKVNRVVPISRRLREYLDHYHPPVVPGRWYFASPDGHRWNTDNFSKRLKRANDALSVPWSCLDFRHTFGSQLAMKGESLYKIATLMGNSPEICRRHYATLLPESLIQSVEFEEEEQQSVEPPPPAVSGRPYLRVIGADGRPEDLPGW